MNAIDGRLEVEFSLGDEDKLFFNGEDFQLEYDGLTKPQIIQGINKNFSMKSKDSKILRVMGIRELVTYYMRKVISL